MQQGFTRSVHCVRDENQLLLPGMHSKARIAPPTLDRLDSGLISPCVSDPTLTNRMFRETLPCTPSPMYAYDAYPAVGSMDGHGRVFPRFFPFAFADAHHIQPKVSRYSSNDTLVDEDVVFMQPRVGIVSSCTPESSPNTTPVARRMLMTPKELRRVSNTVSTPLAGTCSDSSSETAACEPVQILSVLKNSVNANGSFDLSDPIIDINQVIENIVVISRDQAGSRYVQQLLDSKKLCPNEIHQLFVRILPHTRQLTVDQFGNYVVQKLLDDLPESSLGILFNQLTGSLFTFSTHMYGCRVLQRVIDTASVGRLIAITSELKGHVIECVEDQNANHVIQKLIERLPLGDSSIRNLVGEFFGHVPRMAMHCYGCRVIQRMIEKLGGDCLQILISEILANLWQLSQDQYGNYVVQHVLVHGNQSHRSVIVQVIASHIIEFSCHKYASNIAEKAMLCSTDQISRDVIIAAVIGSGGPDSPLFILMKDRFANYVIQRCLEFSHGHQRQMLINILKANLTTLKGVIYGKHIASAIERIMTTTSASSEQTL